MSIRLKTTSLAVLALFLASIALVPTATAQVQPSLTVTGPKNLPATAIKPVEETPQITFDYEYELKGATIQETIGSTTGVVQLSMETTCAPNDNYVQRAGKESVLISLTPGATDQTKTGSMSLQITPTREAPGLELITCTAVFSTTGIGSGSTQQVPPSNTETIRYQFKPDFFSLVEASAPKKLQEGGPQKEVPFIIDVTNFGNAQTRLVFDFVDRPGGKWTGLLPDPVILDPKGGQQASKQATFTVSTPFKNGWNNDQGSFTLKMTPEYALDSSKTGPEVQLTILTRVRGVYVPTLEPIIMLGAVLGSALLLRLKGDEE